MQANPSSIDAGAMAPGETKDFPVQLTGVPPDATASGFIDVSVGSTQISIPVQGTADNPTPTAAVRAADLEAIGITLSVPQIDETGLTIRVSRAP